MLLADLCSVTEIIALGYGNVLKDKAASFIEFRSEF